MTLNARAATACAAVVLANTAFADEANDASGGRLVLGLGTQYDSNVFLVADDEIASASAVLQLGSGYRWQGEVTTFDLAADGRYQRYEETSLSDATAAGVSASLDRQHQRGATRARVSFRNESSLLNAFNDDGKFVGDERQSTGSASLRNMFQLNETNAIVTALEGSRVHYIDTPPDVQRDDYDVTGGTTRWERQVSERATVGVGVVGTWYKSDGRLFTNEVTTFGPELSLEYEFGETLAGSFEASYRKSDGKAEYLGFIEQHDGGANYYGRAALTKLFDRGYVNVEASRTVQPDSNGRQEIRDQVTIGFARELSERSTLRGGAAALRSAPHNEGSVGAAQDRRDAVAADLSFDHELAERLVVSTAYRYVWQDTDADDTEARGQTVSATLRWTFGKP
jgi:hypothetical protein